ncbi:MAG: hypothetical protein Fur0040_11240 [Sideroxydans sp.]
MIERNGNTLRVSGPLTLETVAAHRALGLGAGSQTVVDLSAVSDVDSSAVSLLLSWLRQAQTVHAEVSIRHLPANLRSLIDLYGLSDILDRQIPCKN